MNEFIKFLLKLIIASTLVGIITMILLKIIGYNYTVAYYVPVLVGFLMIIQKYSKK